MLLRNFLATAYALLVEMWQQAGNLDLLSAISKVRTLLGMEEEEETVTEEKIDNDAALARLQSMMAGVAR
jgi:hypothetical protein